MCVMCCVYLHVGKLHFPEGFGESPTSTTELEQLSDHGAPPRARRIAAAHVARGTAARFAPFLSSANLRRCLISESGQSHVSY